MCAGASLGVALACDLRVASEDAKFVVGFGGMLGAVGGMLLVIGLLTRTPEMAIPASIVAGIGGILWVQNTYNNWGTWSYSWALIPGFVGVGILLSGLLGGRNVREAVRELTERRQGLYRLMLPDGIRILKNNRFLTFFQTDAALRGSRLKNRVNSAQAGDLLKNVSQ